MATARRTLPAIRARVYDWKRYERELRKLILNPLFRGFEQRIREAGESYVAIRQAIRDIPLDPALATMSAQAAAAHMARLKAWHIARFRRIMGQTLGVDIRPLASDLGVEGIMRQAIQDNVALIKTIPPRFHADITKRMLTLADTDPFDRQKVQEMLRQTYGSSGYNLRRLTRDQTSKTIGKLNEARQQQAGIDAYQWATSEDEAVRPTHVANNNQTFRWDQPPSATGHPGEDIQCFPGSVRIAPFGMHRTIAYRYVGELVKIFFANGVHITTTPNHPILTQTGWKRASVIDESDQLLMHRFASRLTAHALYPEFDKVHPRAEYLHRLLGGVGNLSGSSGRRVDLHGYHAGRDEAVEVVDVKRELRNHVESRTTETLSDLQFMGTYLSRLVDVLPSLGLFDESLSLPASVPRFGVGRSGELSPLRVGELGEPDVIRLRSASPSEAQINHTRLNDPSTDPELTGHCENGYFGSPELLDFEGERFTPFHVVRPVFCTTLHFDGPVYSFETDSNLILANGVVTHNCRCTALGIVTQTHRDRLKADLPPYK